MSEGCGYTLASAIVESNDAAVRQRQLYFALALLARNLTCNAAVNLICEPVFAGSNLAHMFNMFFVNEQTHALLTFVCDNLLARQCLVAYRQLGHVNLTAALLNEL